MLDSTKVRFMISKHITVDLCHLSHSPELAPGTVIVSISETSSWWCALYRQWIAEDGESLAVTKVAYSTSCFSNDSDYCRAYVKWKQLKERRLLNWSRLIRPLMCEWDWLCMGDNWFVFIVDSVYCTVFSCINDRICSLLQAFSVFRHYYAALLPRRGPHIASHSVCLSVCLSVCPSVRPSRARMYFVYICTVLRAHIQNRKTSVFAYGPASRMYFSARAEGRITYGHLGRTNSCFFLLFCMVHCCI